MEESLSITAVVVESDEKAQQIEIKDSKKVIAGQVIIKGKEKSKESKPESIETMNPKFDEQKIEKEGTSFDDEPIV